MAVESRMRPPPPSGRHMEDYDVEEEEDDEEIRYEFEERRVRGGGGGAGLNELIDRLNMTYNMQLHSASAARIVYKSPYVMPLMFALLALTLLPLQYHTENFGVQMKKMLDSCAAADSTGLFNESQAQILDALFPYGFSGGAGGGSLNLGGGGDGTFNGLDQSGAGFEQLAQELAVIDEIYRRHMADNNLTIKYLTQAECLRKNYTNILNLITISSPPPLPPPASRRITHHDNKNRFHIIFITHFTNFLKYQ